MRRFIFLLLFLSISLMAMQSGGGEDDKLALIKEYKEMFDRISRERKGVDDQEIDRLAEPFVKPKKVAKKAEPTKKGEAKPKPPTYQLQAIFNKRAKISGVWYKVGDEIHGMKLVSIKGNVVWLKNSSFRKRLTLRKENAKISIK